MNAFSSAGVLEFQISSITINEGVGNVELTVLRTGSSAGIVSVDYETSGDTAFSPGDFTSTTNTLVWQNGENSSKVITIPIIDDSLIENQESFNCILSNPINASLGANSIVNIIIDDNDGFSVVQFTTSLISIDEGDGNVLIEVSRTGDINTAASVTYSTFDISAVAGSDYVLTTGTINWGVGDQFTKSFTIPILDDDLTEDIETFRCSITNFFGNATSGTNNEVIISINENDEPSVIQFTSSMISIDEGGGSVLIEVTRTGNTDAEASVTYSTSDISAVAGSDYVFTTGTINWAIGDQATKSITIPIMDDTETENIETFRCSITNYFGNAMSGTNNEVIVTINDNDEPSFIQFTSSMISIDEGGGNVLVEVTRTGNTNSAASVEYSTADFTAVAGVDYVSTTGTINWGIGDQSTKSFTISILDDMVFEDIETFTCSITNYFGNAQNGTNNIIAISIYEQGSSCENAVFLQCTDVIQLSTEGYPTNSIPDCIFSGSSVNLQQLVWFKVLGTGETLTISTCGSNSDYDQEIHVYDGSCSSLDCVEGDGNGCLSSSLPEVSFGTVSGIIYNVAIGTFFNLNASDLTVELQCGDCVDRTNILLSPPNNFSNGDNYIFETNSSVIADNIISSGAVIEYDGMLNVILNPNFEVAIGALFHAYTNGCNN